MKPRLRSVIAAVWMASASASFGQSTSTPAMGERAVGGLSRCENLIGLERDKCLKDGRADSGTGSAGTGSSYAEGPGSRIRATPSGPGAPVQAPPGPADRDAQRCEAMQDTKDRDRCLRELRAAQRDTTPPPHAGPSPETAGPGSAAGSGATTGAGAGPFGGAAPR